MHNNNIRQIFVGDKKNYINKKHEIFIIDKT